jgi:hypothetical protein
MRAVAILPALILANLLISPTSTLGEENQSILRLECGWSASTDTVTGIRSGTTGKKMITVYIEGRKMMKEGLGAVFDAVITDATFEGQTQYSIGGVPFAERLIINRYTGSIDNWVQIGTGGLIHHGVCTKLSGPKF